MVTIPTIGIDGEDSQLQNGGFKNLRGFRTQNNKSGYLDKLLEY